METVSLEQQMARLRRDYLATLPGHVRALNESWRMLRHVRWDEPTLERLRKEAHHLAGSGGTFGFHALTERARELAALLAELSNDGSKVTPGSRKSLEKAIRATVEQIEQALNVRQRPDAVTETGSSARIAILDHDSILAQRLRLWCESWGYEVSVFMSLSAFQEAAAVQPFSLLLADPLPFASVAELIRDVMSEVPTPLPILIMSARTDVTARLEALRAGASGYLVRPLDDDALGEEIVRVLEANQGNRPRVLLVDDDKSVTALYQRILDHHGFETRTLSNPMAILDVMARHRPDILVVDYQMPGMTGLELVRLLRQQAEYIQLPVVFMSARPDVLEGQSLMSVADDVLVKPLDDQLLVDTLRRSLARARQLSRNMDRVSGRHDNGGLQNRPRFFQQLERDLSRCRIADSAGSDLLLFVAADKSDYLRQRHGLMGCAQLGDEVERWLAAQPAIAGRGCPVSDLAWLVRARLGADSSAADTAEALRRDLSQTRFTIGGAEQTFSFSAGGVMLSCELPDAGQVTRAVEAACNEATAAGGQRTLLSAVGEKKEYRPLEARLGKALQTRSFTLQFQPVVNLETNHSFFQALLRLRDDEGNLYLPDEFMASVPQYLSDGMVGMDRWVIEAAVDALSNLHGREAEVGSLVVKLSSGIEGLTRLLPFIANVMQNSRLRGERRLYFAFRESFVLEHMDSVKPLLDKLVRLNIGIVIENFGVSKHGEELLRELPVIDFLRLDPGWNRRVNEAEEVSALMEMVHARFAGMDRVIASHVEEAKTFSAFWDMGIRHFQGFFVQQPGDAMQVI